MSDNSKSPNTSHWTIGKYASEIYIPRRSENGPLAIAATTAKNYRLSIGAFEKSQGGPVKLRTITPDMVAAFHQWCLDSGCAAGTARSRCEVVRAVVRHWRPGALPAEIAASVRPDMAFLYADTPGTLEHLMIDRYLPSKPRIGPSTTRQYGKVLSRFREFLGRPATTDDLTDETVGRFLRWLVDTKGIRATSANGEVKQLKALWNWAAKKRLVEHFPTLDKLPEPERTPDSWTEQELWALYHACENAPGWMDRCKASDWWTAFHLVLWDTGERTGAMLAMQWSWLDANSGLMLVPGEFRKGGVKAMTYHLKPETCAALERIRAPERDVIFIRPFGHASSFHNAYRRLVESAGLKYNRHKSGPQKMRRTFASFIARNGGDATRALRHSTRRVTEESYLDPRIAETESENVRLPSLAEIVSSHHADGGN